MKPIVLSRRATREWRQLAGQLAANDPTTPAKLAADLSTTFQAIATFPQGLPDLGRGLRRAVVQKWSLGIYYRLSRHRITVVAIIDLRRDPLAVRSRLGLHEDAIDFATPSVARAATEDRTAESRLMAAN
jgi:plasmid stabilization system protein ParE